MWGAPCSCCDTCRGRGSLHTAGLNPRTERSKHPPWPTRMGWGQSTEGRGTAIPKHQPTQTRERPPLAATRAGNTAPTLYQHEARKGQILQWGRSRLLPGEGQAPTQLLGNGLLQRRRLRAAPIPSHCQPRTRLALPNPTQARPCLKAASLCKSPSISEYSRRCGGVA